MVLWLDGNALFFGARELRARSGELLRVIAAVGEIDAAVSIASYRAGTTAWTRPILKPSGPVLLDDMRHPLLPDAVPNSIALLPPNGVIITGSNMSGKSTFLRTVGVTAILAQTINTCLARRYEAPPFVVRSCIGMADDPATGKSYYLVEVESVVALLNAARGGVPHLMLFDELFRGTNAVERIASGEAVLAALVAARSTEPARHVVVAATHDQELVDLLQGLYVAHHFTDSIDSHGLSFDYKLHPGPATTRNAIALLGQRGAPAEVVRTHSSVLADLTPPGKRHAGNRMLRLAVLCGMTLAVTAAPDPAVAPQSITAETVFADEFSGLNSTDAEWNVVVTGRTVNNEQQAYIDSPETIGIVSGEAAAGAERGRWRPRGLLPGFKTPEGRAFDFISGRIDTRGKVEFAYGTAAARVKLPAGAGLWPAFWRSATADGRTPRDGISRTSAIPRGPTSRSTVPGTRAIRRSSAARRCRPARHDGLARLPRWTGRRSHSSSTSMASRVPRLRSDGGEVRPVGVRLAEVPHRESGARWSIPAERESRHDALRGLPQSTVDLDQSRPRDDARLIGFA